MRRGLAGRRASRSGVCPNGCHGALGCSYGFQATSAPEGSERTETSCETSGHKDRREGSSVCSGSLEGQPIGARVIALVGQRARQRNGLVPRPLPFRPARETILPRSPRRAGRGRPRQSDVAAASVLSGRTRPTRTASAPARPQRRTGGVARDSSREGGR